MLVTSFCPSHLVPVEYTPLALSILKFSFPRQNTQDPRRFLPPLFENFFFLSQSLYAFPTILHSGGIKPLTLSYHSCLQTDLGMVLEFTTGVFLKAVSSRSLAVRFLRFLRRFMFFLVTKRQTFPPLAWVRFFGPFRCGC